MRARALITAAVVAILCAGCAQQSSRTATSSDAAAGGAVAPAVATTTSSAAIKPHPQAIEPVAGAGAGSGAGAGAGSAVTGAGAGSGSPAASVSVGPAGAGPTLPRPQTDTDIMRQLARSGMTGSPNQATLTPSGLAVAPIDAPAAVQEVIAAGNEIARLPYRWAGGHETYEDTAYDCSGSISFVFAAAHLLDHTVASGELMNWGEPGPGKWITVFANAGHTFIYVAGLRFDTVALAQTGTRWSARSANEPDLSTFSVRHPPGL